jgi:CBS domain containing-hemolysin-like protein
MTALIVITLLTIGLSAMCSLFEAVLYSTRLSAVEAELQSESPNRRRVSHIMERMQKNIPGPLATILIINTLANTAGATLAGTCADGVLSPRGIIIFSFGLTLSILVFSEIIPKTLGALHWRSLWPIITVPLSFLELAIKPITFLIRQLTDRLSRGNDDYPSITEEEILGSFKLGVEAGEVEKWESEIVHNLIDLENKKISTIMTPRTVIFMLPDSTTIGEAFQQAAREKFTRIPVFLESRDDIIGYITLHEIALAVALKRHEHCIRELLKPLVFTPETASCSTVLIRFLRNREHISIVADEFGGVAGVVSLEDLIETAAGTEIVDEHDDAVDLREVAMGKGHHPEESGTGS